MEQNIEVNENDEVIGARPRTDFYNGNHIHRSTYLILFNSKDEILLQKRALTKKWYPSLYTFAVARTVQEGESYKDSMIKGLKEKIGISTPIKFLFKFFFQEKSDRAFRAVFIAKSDDKIKPNKKDIAEIEWVNVSKFKKDIVKNPERYAPSFIACMKKYFAEFYTVKK